MELDPQRQLADQFEKPSRNNLTLWVVVIAILVVGIAALLAVRPFLPATDRMDKLYAQGEREFRAQDFAAAAKTFEEVTRLDPKQGLAWNYLGVIAGGQGRFEAAEKFHRKAIEVDPLTMANYNNLAQLYLHVGRLDEAETECQASMKLGPKVQYLLLSVRIAQKRKLPDAEIVRRLRLVIDSAPGHAVQPGALPAQSGAIAGCWTIAATELLVFNDTYGLVGAARVYTDANTRPDVAELAGNVLRQSGAPATLLAALADDRAEVRTVALKALEKLTAAKVAFDPEADDATRANQITALKQNPVLNRSEMKPTQTSED